MFADNIAKVSLDLFNSLSKTGKPLLSEWTVLASILVEFNNKLEVVALGTGTKCIGKSQMSSEGIVLNDFHAEVVCRRAFLRYLYNEMRKERSEILVRDDGKLFTVEKGAKFHMYSSLMPCGDASIFPKNHGLDESDYGTVLINENHDEDEHGSTAKKIKLDYHRTGAKCLPNDDKVDAKELGNNYHVLGAVRSKPGRGDPTLSASCSDKLAKWLHLGLQGSLMSLLLDEPIYLSSITIGHEHYCVEALERAFFKRFGDTSPSTHQEKFKLHIPGMFQSTIHAFDAHKCATKQPAPASIIYIKDCKTEVAVEGFKQGVTKKNRLKPSGRLQVCKKELFSCFVQIAKMLKLDVDLNSSYGALKNTTVYAKCWKDLKRNKFKVWPSKSPMLEAFCYDT